MKKVLLDVNGKVWEVLGSDLEVFDVYEGAPDFLRWEETEDDLVSAGEFKEADGTFVNRGIQDSLGETGLYIRFKKNRELAYGDIGKQLGMIYDDAMSGTTTWMDAITAAKAEVPKVDAPADYVEVVGKPVVNPPTR